MTEQKILIHTDKTDLRGTIKLRGSKSISNRVLLIDALSEDPIEMSGLSDSDDTVTLRALLASTDDTLDCGHAGTTFRFLTAYLSLSSSTKVLTGSARMLQRPVGPLVDALRSLGARIDYLGEEGYPPLRIGPYDATQYRSQVSIDAGVSSQYISALLMIAPTLPTGLQLRLEGDIVSRTYIDMTLRIMQHFDIKYRWIDDNHIDIPAQRYISKPYRIEADWSAASYYYALAAISSYAEITLHGLYDQQLQGDSAIVSIGTTLGVSTEYHDSGITITKSKETVSPSMLEYDFLLVPDIAQTIAVTCAAMGITGLYSGLKTLRIKETDRIAALQTELSKIQVYLSRLPPKFSKKSGVEYYMLEGKATIEDVPTFDTYHDHRMAMAFAPLALKGDIMINDPSVVTKSYGAFWDDLRKLGFTITG